MIGRRFVCPIGPATQREFILDRRIFGRRKGRSKGVDETHQGAWNILIKISKTKNPHIAYPVCVRTHVPCPSILSLPANKPSANLACLPTSLPKVGKMSLQPDGPSW